MKVVLASALKKFDPLDPIPKLETDAKGGRSLYEAPEGGLIVAVTSKVLGGYAARTEDNTLKIRRDSMLSDHKLTDRLDRFDLASAPVQGRTVPKMV